MGKENRRKLQAIILNMAVLIFLLLASCSPVYYGPSAPVLSGFEEKGDVSITAGFNLTESDFRQNNFNISFGAQFSFNAYNLK